MWKTNKSRLFPLPPPAPPLLQTRSRSPFSPIPIPLFLLPLPAPPFLFSSSQVANDILSSCFEKERGLLLPVQWSNDFGFLFLLWERGLLLWPLIERFRLPLPARTRWFHFRSSWIMWKISKCFSHCRSPRLRMQWLLHQTHQTHLAFLSEWVAPFLPL